MTFQMKREKNQSINANLWEYNRLTEGKRKNEKKKKKTKRWWSVVNLAMCEQWMTSTIISWHTRPYIYIWICTLLFCAYFCFLFFFLLTTTSWMLRWISWRKCTSGNMWIDKDPRFTINPGRHTGGRRHSISRQYSLDLETRPSTR